MQATTRNELPLFRMGWSPALADPQWVKRSWEKVQPILMTLSNFALT